MPIGEGNVAGVAQAAKSRHAVRQAVSNSGRGHKMLDCIDGADRRLAFQSAQPIHFLPEANRIAQLAFGNEAQPLMFFAQHEGAALVAQAFAITFERGVTDVFFFERQLSRLDGKMGAHREPHQIDGVGHRPRFIEVVDTPDEAAFDVPPGAEVFHMEIANREDVGAFARSEQICGQSCAQR